MSEPAKEDLSPGEWLDLARNLADAVNESEV